MSTAIKASSPPSTLAYTITMSNKAFDYGDLRVTMTKDYSWIWDDSGSGASRSVTIWSPNSQDGLSPVGDYVQPLLGYKDFNGSRASLLVGQNPNTKPSKPAVARPTGYTLVWGDWGSGGKHDGRIFRPVAPEGYIALGDVAINSYDATPSLNRIWCQQALGTTVGQAQDDRGSGAGSDVSLWSVQPVALGVDGAEKLPVLADNFRAQKGYNRPNGEEARVLLLPNPKNFDQFDDSPPELTATKLPSRGDQFSSKQQAKVTLPFHCFFKPTHQESLDNIRNPFLTISRTTAWYVEGVWSNNTAGSFAREQKLLCGVTKQKTDEMSHSAGIEVSSTFGIKGAEFSVTLNYQFTYTTSTSLTEFFEREVTEKFDVPAHSATVLFSKHVWIKASRLDSPVVLHQMEMTANDDVYFKGCPLR
ncbi:hypothetical protein HJFPF1_05477 [Paramyrothecium foliicola]|nr:hypothetical protein HJFPF1_05477 [Paramyrothecium foliicola]